MAKKVSRYKKRSSSRSGFDYFEHTMITQDGHKIGADEYDIPAPSKQPLGGEGEISRGAMRDVYQGIYLETTAPAHLKKTIYLIGTDGISWQPVDWIRIAGKNAVTDLASNPQITAPDRHERMFCLECVSNKVILENANGLSMAGSALFTMDSGALISFIYNSGNTIWQETSRSHKTKRIDI